MQAKSIRLSSLIAGVLGMTGCVTTLHGAPASWLDTEHPAAWNEPGREIPAAPDIEANDDPRCRELVRPPQLDEDRRVHARGWDLIGSFEGGWDVVIVRGAAAYDGMCRPLQYQAFVFVRGVFAGTLSPVPMDSRIDGALGTLSLQSGTELIAEYVRYEESDPMCCPSRRTTVFFEISKDPPLVRPATASTSSTQN
jgi:hypothetical protein